MHMPPVRVIDFIDSKVLCVLRFVGNIPAIRETQIQINSLATTIGVEDIEIATPYDEGRWG